VPSRTWGFTPDEWAGHRRELESLLEHAAAARSTVTYGEVARRVFEGRVTPRSGALLTLLGEVDSATYEARGIMLAALVVRADTGMPGEGFFAFASDELGRQALADPRGFWEREVERVWDAYAVGKDAGRARAMRSAPDGVA
jgi:hypothetical protein